MYGRNDGNKIKTQTGWLVLYLGSFMILYIFLLFCSCWLLALATIVGLLCGSFLLCFISLCHFVVFFIHFSIFCVCKEHLYFFRDEQSRELCFLYLILFYFFKWLLCRNLMLISGFCILKYFGIVI